MNAIISLCRVDWVAVGTWALAAVTLMLFRATKGLVKEAQASLAAQAADSKQRAEDSKTDLKVRLHMTMEEKFDSDQMVLNRARLAFWFLNKAPHDEIREPVLDFFESLAILDRRGMLDAELTWNSFSFYATRWWSACKGYVAEERKRQEEDPNQPLSFTEFEAFAARLYDKEAQERGTARSEVEAEPDSEETKKFLRDEFALKPDIREYRPS